MTALAGPYLIVCTILGLGGIGKLVAPTSARRALHALGVTVAPTAIRLLGAAEIALACAAAALGGVALPAIVGAAYVSFAAFVVVMLRSGTATSCGCFGSAATPPSALHVLINLGSAAVAFVSIGGDDIGAILSDQPGAGIPMVGLVVLGSYLLYLLLTLLPVVLAPPQPRVTEFSIPPRTAP